MSHSFPLGRQTVPDRFSASIRVCNPFSTHVMSDVFWFRINTLKVPFINYIWHKMWTKLRNVRFLDEILGCISPTAPFKIEWTRKWVTKNYLFWTALLAWKVILIWVQRNSSLVVVVLYILKIAKHLLKSFWTDLAEESAHFYLYFKLFWNRSLIL